MQQSSSVFVLTVPSTDDLNPKLDVKDILRVIGPRRVVDLVWGVSSLECFGSEILEPFLHELETSPNRRLLVSGTRLLTLAEEITQTLEGVFVGYTSNHDATNFLSYNWTKSQFPASTAEVGIEVVDGWLIDVYLRSRPEAERIASSFQDVEWQDPADFCM